MLAFASAKVPPRAGQVFRTRIRAIGKKHHFNLTALVVIPRRHHGVSRRRFKIRNSVHQVDSGSPRSSCRERVEKVRPPGPRRVVGGTSLP